MKQYHTVWEPLNQRWIAHHKAAWMPSTVERMLRAAQNFYRWAQTNGLTDPRQVKIEDITRWIEHRKNAGASNTLLAYEVSIIHSVFSFCEMDKLIERGCNPADARWMPRIVVPASDRAAFSYADYLRAHKEAERHYVTRGGIFSRAYHEDFGPLIAVGWYTGLRLGDCCSLQWDSVNFDQEIVVVRTRKKTQRGEVLTIPMEPELYDLLMDLWKKTEANPGARLVNVMPYAAALFTRANRRLTWLLRRIFDKAGLGHLSFHSLRHGFVTRLLNAGVDPITIGSMTGQTIDQIQEYAHVSVEAKASALERARQSLVTARAAAEEVVL